jgi:hypothetical protein
MSSTEDLGIERGTRLASVPDTHPVPHRPRDPWLRIGPEGLLTSPLAGQPGHSRTAFVRLQPACIVDGRIEGGYSDRYELVCPSCGDHPYMDYADLPQWLQHLRGPRTLQAAVAAYEEHIGLTT